MSDRLTMPRLHGKGGPIRHCISTHRQAGQGRLPAWCPALPSGVSTVPPVSTQHDDGNFITHEGLL